MTPTKVSLKYILTFSVFLLCLTCHGQENTVLLRDSAAVPTEKVDTLRKPTTHSPAKASLYSAVLPGLGQAYNKRYWKIPIVYAGFAAGLFGVKLNNDFLQEARQDLFDFVNGRPTVFTNEDQIRNRIERFRRDRDFLIILTGVWYGLQIAEAHVDAHLREFKVDDDLSFKITPSFDQESIGPFTAGISLKFYLK